MQSPNMDARIDICDFFVFQKPKDPSRSIIVFNVNPFAPTRGDSFAPEAVYEIKIDTNGDAVAEIAYRISFTEKEHGAQLATVRRAAGKQAQGNGNEGEVLFDSVPVSFEEKAIIDEAGGYRFFAGIRSDPFFIDLDGLLDGMKFTGADYFADKNVYSIVLDLPNSALGYSSKIGIWTRVLIPKDEDPYFQIDRMGRPFINVTFTKDEDKDEFNQIEPTRDRELFTDKFIDMFVSRGYGQEEARKTALELLPDILGYDYSSAAGYPNGRNLTDDVIDYQLAILTHGTVTTDKVGPHEDLLDEFPYVGRPHPSPQSPSPPDQREPIRQTVK
jgi:hypothetical protein